MMKHSAVFDRLLIAPCGINCGTCLAYLREKNRCCGCLIETFDKADSRARCIIKNCERLAETKSGFCFECETFPCKRLKQLDKRYRTKYRVSLIQNLLSIKEIGIKEYLQKESGRWTCPHCGEVVCVHRDACLLCKQDISEFRERTKNFIS
jgi:hypothetical protein